MSAKNKRFRLGRGTKRLAVTLVELLVVVSIIGLLMAMLLPAVQAAREASRRMACQSNLRQIGIGFQEHASIHGAFCSGAFDWKRDGCVTKVGWVADLVAAGIPVGKMLCPTSECRLSQTYNDLLNLDVTSVDDCVNLAGSAPTYEPDGTAIGEPCWKIVNDGLSPGNEERRVLIEEDIFLENYNTNYTASWYLVRSAVSLDSSGNLAKHTETCESSTLSRNSTLGPLSLASVDASKKCPSSFIPLMGCGQRSGELAKKIGPNEGGTPLSLSFTSGPVENPGMKPPSFDDGTSRGGPSGWWATWDKSTLQDYRGFAPVHRGMCNILFADGSVRPYLDKNGDGLLNNGFEPTEENGFADADLELNPKEFASSWKLK